MKVIYTIREIDGGERNIASFTDLKKAEQAFEIYADYVKDNYSTDVEYEIQGYKHFCNGIVLVLDESKIVTNIKDFRKLF